jgi:hypothetical protein
MAKTLTEVEILRRVVKQQVLNGELTLKPNDLKRKLGVLAKACETTNEELNRVMKPIMDEVFRDVNNTLTG